MPTITLKQSSVSGVEPHFMELEDGELAINTKDGKLFVKNTTTNEVANISLRASLVTAGSKNTLNLTDDGSTP